MNVVIKILTMLFFFLFTIPFILEVYALTPFLGKKKAIQFVGRQLTPAAAWIAKVIVPRINTKRDFSVFKRRLKRNFLFFGKLYHLKIENETPDTIEFRFRFCPVTNFLTIFGLKDLCKYSCAGDWKLAEENKDYWTFNRDQSIGTGGLYCNHTYSRKK